jgi:hypothetical protein
MDRKTFISRLMRYSLLGGLTLLTGFLLARRSVSGQAGCRINPLCSNCPELTACTKQEALKQKKNGEKE